MVVVESGLGRPAPKQGLPGEGGSARLLEGCADLTHHITLLSPSRLEREPSRLEAIPASHAEANDSAR